jgi:hypothetical protein
MWWPLSTGKWRSPIQFRREVCRQAESLQERAGFCRKKGTSKYYMMVIVCRKEEKSYSVQLLCYSSCLKERGKNCRIEDKSVLKVERWGRGLIWDTMPHFT